MPTPIASTTSDELVDALNDPHLALNGAPKLCERQLISRAFIRSNCPVNAFKLNQHAALLRTAVNRCDLLTRTSSPSSELQRVTRQRD